MSSKSRVSSWVAAASILAVEALKDQGFARWNYPLRVVQQHAKSNLRSYISQAKKNSGSGPGSSSAMAANKRRDEKLKQSEESFRKVMYLSCWGPN